MATEIRVPSLGESVVEATVGQWFKQAGDTVAADEPLVELETDKVTVEVPAPASGVLSESAVKAGDTVAVGALLGAIRDGVGAAKPVKAKRPPASSDLVTAEAGAVADEPSMRAPKAPPTEPKKLEREPSPRQEVGNDDMPPSPAARKLLVESDLSAEEVAGSGRRGQVLKDDVVKAAEALLQRERKEKAPSPPRAPVALDDAAREERVKMTRLRQTIARRLKDVQNTAAMLTTFNEVDMTNVMALRSQYKDVFEKKHGTKLGFMGFFTKACVQALKDIPAVNAEIDGSDLIFKNYYHVGIAVGTDKGLVVPVVRDCDHKSISDIEKAISDFGRRARDGQLKIDEMQGGTFTITNGGIYGSLMSTPILNAPQSGILGMHKIQERPMVVGGKIEVRPMMYLALSYDHRVIDGKEAVTFLVRVKESLEDPARLVLDL